MGDWLQRTRLVLTGESMEKLAAARVMVVGLGGVGGATAEALARAGIGRLILVDHDAVAESNLNRQILTHRGNIGRLKADEAKLRIQNINPGCDVDARAVFFDESTAEELLQEWPDFIIDAIDTVKQKLLLIAEAHRRKIPIASSMGTGNRLDPTMLAFADIYETSGCPLAKAVRSGIRKLKIEAHTVLYSREVPIKAVGRTPGSVSWVPPCAGFMLAGYAARHIAGI